MHAQTPLPPGSAAGDVTGRQNSTAASPALGIIAGSGNLPHELIAHCQSTGRHFFVLTFDDIPQGDIFQNVPHAVVRLGAVGEALDILKRAQVKELVLAGKIRRPSFSSLRPDFMGTKLLTRLGSSLFSGDDALLKTVVSFLEEQGFIVVGADTVLAGLITPGGVLGAIQPSADDIRDIHYGINVAKQLGALDIGQAVIVENGYVLGVEAAEGTDALIERCASLKRESRGGVLIKMRKPTQETRVDLPAVGIETVKRLHNAGFAGIAIETHGTLMIDKEKMIAEADACGLFIVGIRHE